MASLRRGGKGRREFWEGRRDLTPPSLTLTRFARSIFPLLPPLDVSFNFVYCTNEAYDIHRKIDLSLKFCFCLATNCGQITL